MGAAERRQRGSRRWYRIIGHEVVEDQYRSCQPGMPDASSGFSSHGRGHGSHSQTSDISKIGNGQDQIHVCWWQMTSLWVGCRQLCTFNVWQKYHRRNQSIIMGEIICCQLVDFWLALGTALKFHCSAWMQTRNNQSCIHWFAMQIKVPHASWCKAGG